MGRSSQVLILEVLLIVAAMLCVVLGVTTYLNSKKADEQTKLYLAEKKDKEVQQSAVTERQKECDTLKSYLGLSGGSDEIAKQFKEDMVAFGGEKAEGDAAQKTFTYHSLLANLNTVIQDRNTKLASSEKREDDLKRQLASCEARSEDKFKAITADHTALQAEVTSIVTAVNSGSTTTAEHVKELGQRVVDADKKAATAAADADAKTKAAQDEIKKKEEEVRAAVKERTRVERKEMDVPSGEITWVSLPNKLVWINRGQADFLQRGTQFTVYSAESSNGPNAAKKGQIEVVHIEGDHTAQCRILDDKLADPIMAGDKVFTPLWSPGQQNHFALTGVMDLDGDGQNQLGVVRGLINKNGGEVDCWLDERGDKQGQITVATRYLVVGPVPDKSSEQNFVAHNGEILATPSATTSRS